MLQETTKNTIKLFIRSDMKTTNHQEEKKEMESYPFYQDRKVTCWERTRFTVQAASYAHAVAQIKAHNGEDVID